MDYKALIVNEILYDKKQTVLKRLYIPYDGELDNKTHRYDIAYRAGAPKRDISD